MPVIHNYPMKCCEANAVTTDDWSIHSEWFDRHSMTWCFIKLLQGLPDRYDDEQKRWQWELSKQRGNRKQVISLSITQNRFWEWGKLLSEHYNIKSTFHTDIGIWVPHKCPGNRQKDESVVHKRNDRSKERRILLISFWQSSLKVCVADPKGCDVGLLSPRQWHF